MQLVAYGAQDAYLTGNPQITFFKIVYRRHHTFAMESVFQPIHDSFDFDKEVNIIINKTIIILWSKINLIMIN